MVLLWYYNGNIMVLLWYYHRVYLGGTGEEHRRIIGGRTNLKHEKSPSFSTKDKISKVRKNEILDHKKFHLVGWKCYLRKTTLNNPKKTCLSLCYVKKKLYFCTRKINAKRARGSKNRQKRDFNVKISTKK